MQSLAVSSSCPWKEQTSLEHFPASILSGTMQSFSGTGSMPCCGSGKELTHSMVGLSLLGVVPVGGKEATRKQLDLSLDHDSGFNFSSTCRGYTGDTQSLCPCCPLHPLMRVLPNSSNSERRKGLQELLLLSSPRRWSEDLPELPMLRAQL